MPRLGPGREREALRSGPPARALRPAGSSAALGPRRSFPQPVLLVRQQRFHERQIVVGESSAGCQAQRRSTTAGSRRGSRSSRPRPRTGEGPRPAPTASPARRRRRHRAGIIAVSFSRRCSAIAARISSGVEHSSRIFRALPDASIQFAIDPLVCGGVRPSDPGLSDRAAVVVVANTLGRPPHRRHDERRRGTTSAHRSRSPPPGAGSSRRTSTARSPSPGRPHTGNTSAEAWSTHGRGTPMTTRADPDRS